MLNEDYDEFDDVEEDDYDDHLQKEPIKHEIRINDEKYWDKKIVELFGSFIKSFSYLFLALVQLKSSGL